MTVIPPTTLEQALAMAEEAERLRVKSEDLARAVAPALAYFRTEANASQTSVANAAGVSQGSVSRVESGDRLYTPTILSVTRALHDYSNRAANDLADARKGT